MSAENVPQQPPVVEAPQPVVEAQPATTTAEEAAPQQQPIADVSPPRPPTGEQPPKVSSSQRSSVVGAVAIGASRRFKSGIEEQGEGAGGPAFVNTEVLDEEDDVTIELGEQLQYEMDQYLQGKPIQYIPAMDAVPTRRETLVTAEMYGPSAQNRIPHGAISATAASAATLALGPPRSPRRHVAACTSTHAALNNTSLPFCPPPTLSTRQRVSSANLKQLAANSPTTPKTTSPQQQQLPPVTSPRTVRMLSRLEQSPKQDQQQPRPYSPPERRVIINGRDELIKKEMDTLNGGADLRTLIAQQRAEDDPYSIRGQLKAIKPLPALCRIMHAVPVIDEEFPSKRLFGLKALQKAAFRLDPAVRWRNLTEFEAKEERRKEAARAEEEAQQARFKQLMEEQRRKPTQYEQFQKQYEASKFESKLQAAMDEERIKALDRKIAATETRLKREKMFRDREVTEPVVHKIFDEGRQIKESVLGVADTSPSARTVVPSAILSARSAKVSGGAAAPPGTKPPAPQLTKLPPLNDAEVQAKKARHHSEMQERIARLKQSVEALEDEDEVHKRLLESTEKDRVEWEAEKRRLLLEQPRLMDSAQRSMIAITSSVRLN